MHLIEPSYGLDQGCATFSREGPLKTFPAAQGPLKTFPAAQGLLKTFPAAQGPLKTFPAAQGPQLNRYKTCVESIKINIHVIVTSTFY